MKPHPDIEKLEELFPYIRQYQELASVHGVDDIFLDNGGKLLQVLLLTGLENIAGRAGNDAVDMDGNEYELKSVDLTNTSPQFTTHHHLNLDILAKYRQVDWVFATYEGIEIQEIYQVPPERLEGRYFEKWESRLTSGRDHINNPKISVGVVRRLGEQIYPPAPQHELFDESS